MKRKKNINREDIYEIAVFFVLALILFWTALKNGETWAIITAIVVFLAIVFFVFFFIRYKKKRKLKVFSTKMREIDKMNGIEFEQYLGELYSALGYKTKVTQASGDFGADVILEKGQLRTVVQAKHYKNPVGFKAVQEINTAKGLYKADEAIVVTNSPSFTRHAIVGAKKLRVKLISRKDLQNLIDTSEKVKQKAEKSELNQETNL